MTAPQKKTAPRDEARGGVDSERVGDEVPIKNVTPHPQHDKTRLGIIEAVRRMSDAGLSVIPVSADPRRTPLVKGFTKRAAAPRFSSIARHWEGASGVVNVAIVTGALSRLTVIDVDEAGDDALDTALGHFGPTPAIVQTGSGWHLYYRHNGEQCRPSLGASGLKGDVKGEGGIVLSAPSLHPTGRLYRWFRGGVDELVSDRLPTILEDALPSADIGVVSNGRIPAGNRGTTLFKELRLHVRRCASLDELVVCAHEIRARMEQPAGDPFTIQETTKTAESVWEWWETNPARGQDRFGKVTVAETLELWPRSADAVVLLLYLRGAGHAIGSDFAISPKAIATAIKVGIKRIRRARDILIEGEWVVQVHQGGKLGDGDPHKFQWGARSAAVLMDRGEGAKLTPNTDIFTRPPDIREPTSQTIKRPLDIEPETEAAIDADDDRASEIAEMGRSVGLRPASPVVISDRDLAKLVRRSRGDLSPEVFAKRLAPDLRAKCPGIVWHAGAVEKIEKCDGLGLDDQERSALIDLLTVPEDVPAKIAEAI